MKNRNHYNHFSITVWSRDCEVPEHRVYDASDRLVKNCDLCSIYQEKMPLDFVKAVLYPLWMDLE